MSRSSVNCNDVSITDPSNAIDIGVNAAVDWDAATRQFQLERRVRIGKVLSSGADTLFDHFADTDEWIQVINHPPDVIEVDLDEWQAMPGRKKSSLIRAMHQRASTGFQYSYAAIGVPKHDEADQESGPIADFARFMNSHEILDKLEAVTGHRDLVFTDGQATVYNPGDFLTGHDDAVPGRNRVAAFVLGLTPVWRLEWGGLLIFHPTDHQPALTLVPQFNTLDLFAVPQLHSVSMVSPAAIRPRFALTGWLSARSA